MAPIVTEPAIDDCRAPESVLRLEGQSAGVMRLRRQFRPAVELATVPVCGEGRVGAIPDRR